MTAVLIRVVNNMATAPLEYLDLSAVSYVHLVYDHSIKVFPSLQCKIKLKVQSSANHFPKFF